MLVSIPSDTGVGEIFWLDICTFINSISNFSYLYSCFFSAYSWNSFSRAILSLNFLVKVYLHILKSSSLCLSLFFLFYSIISYKASRSLAIFLFLNKRTSICSDFSFISLLFFSSYYILAFRFYFSSFY